VSEVRKASDVLLGLESSISLLVKEVQSQNLLLKIISNKLSDLLAQKPITVPKDVQPKITVEAVNTQSLNSLIPQIEPDRNIIVSAEDAIKIDNSPQGFRRTSRPETFAGDNSYLNKAPSMKEQPIKYPTQIPRPNGGAEVIVVPDVATQTTPPTPPAENKAGKNIGSVPVKQRVVDGTGKSIFMADVEVFDSNSNQSVVKSRTNGTGKWLASLPLGNYKIVIKKRDSMSKETKEVSQPLSIDGSVNPLELPVIVIK
jgi:hypothetical protein